VEAVWRAEWADAAAASVYGNAQSHPRVRPWRDRFQGLGVSGKQFPSSIEALLRRALKGGEPLAIYPLVNWYNALSLRHVVPAGGFDLDVVATLGGLLELRLTRAGDSFTALDAETAAPGELVAPGEVAYAAGQTVLTRHFVWRQARAGLIARETRDVFLVSEILGEVGAQVAAAMRADFGTGLRDHFGVTPTTWPVDAAHLQIAW
jgi:DNA/RNA-binding domain of Phe-tRNA-synthetase-like protein